MFLTCLNKLYVVSICYGNCDGDSGTRNMPGGWGRGGPGVADGIASCEIAILGTKGVNAVERV